MQNPVTRFKTWIERNGWWNEEHEYDVRNRIKKEVTVSSATMFHAFGPILLYLS